jgi:ADP-heptose:LPS heptosyltransferase
MIVIAPYAKQLLSGKRNPKNYPFWDALIPLLPRPIVQVGIDGEKQLVQDFRKNLPVQVLRNLIGMCDTWISCDSFFQHLAWDEGKPGIVLWSVSDPNIFGHSENINLLKSRDCLAPNQFLWWEATEYDPNKFVEPERVLEALQAFIFTEA